MPARPSPLSLPAVLALALTAATSPAGAEKMPTTLSQGTTVSTPFPSALQPLAQAVAEGDTDTIARLTPAAPPTAHGQDNVTLLEWAIWNRRADSLAALLQAGLDPAIPGMDGESVAHLAASVDDPRYLQVLIGHGAAVDLTGGKAGRTPIFRAVQSRRSAQFELLLAAGADINRSDAMGNTLLHVAAEVGDAGRVLQLLEAGAHPDATNSRGVSFQTLLFAEDPARLNAKGRAERQAVQDWLAANR